MGLQTRMFLLIAVMFAVLYGVITVVGNALGIGSALTYVLLAFGFMLLQYLIGPAIVGWTNGFPRMRNRGFIKWLRN